MSRRDATRWPAWHLVREARRRAGLTHAELAARVGHSPLAIIRFERALTSPDLPTLHRIAEACGLRLSLELAEPDAEQEAAELAALDRSVEERLLRNERHVAKAHALQHG